MSETVFLPIRRGCGIAEAKFRKDVNAKCTDLLATVDEALRFRTAPKQAQAVRNVARARLQDFAVQAGHAYDLRAATVVLPPKE